MQARGIFDTRAHFGWAHYLLRQIAKRAAIAKPASSWLDRRLDAYTDKKSAKFDSKHGTETFTRDQCAVSEGVSVDEMCWGYGPVNHDFFREIIQAIPVELSQYAFVDVGAGKGAALMMASEHDFKRVIGVELSQDLIDVGKENAKHYANSTKRDVNFEWVQADFLKWPIIEEDSIFFFNNPLPREIALQAVQHIEDAALVSKKHMIIAYRKAPINVEKYLSISSNFIPLRLAPYWRIYGSQ